MSVAERVAVLGAGVIGQVYAALLSDGGVDVRLLARGNTLSELRARGVRLRRGGPDAATCTAPVPVQETDSLPAIDILIVAVRVNQLQQCLPIIEHSGARIIVPLMHLGDQRTLLDQHVGTGRVVEAFPGVGGYQDHDGAIVWESVPQQHTTVERGGADADEVRRLLAKTALPVAVEPHMPDWLNTHTIFVACLSKGVLAAGGDASALARDTPLLRRMVRAIRSGFAGYRDRGGQLRPFALALLFTRMPVWFAVRYWRAQLLGPVGQITIAPHVRSSTHDETPLVIDHAIELTTPYAGEMKKWLIIS